MSSENYGSVMDIPLIVITCGTALYFFFKLGGIL